MRGLTQIPCPAIAVPVDWISFADPYVSGLTQIPCQAIAVPVDWISFADPYVSGLTQIPCPAIAVPGVFYLSALANKFATLPNKKPRHYRARVFVPRTGFEPAHLAAPPPEDGASTNFATWAVIYKIFMPVRLPTCLPAGRFRHLGIPFGAANIRNDPIPKRKKLFFWPATRNQLISTPAYCALAHLHIYIFTHLPICPSSHLLTRLH